MEPIKVQIKNILQKVAGSLKQKMPIITVPTAPIPVQTAYAVPIGKVWVALLSSTKLIVMHTKNATLHLIFEKLFDNLRQVVKPTSKSPAMIKIIQFI